MAVSAPALSNFFRGRTLASEARRFVSLARYGQSRAVSEGIPMVLWMDIRQGRYGVQQEPGFSDMDTQAVTFTLGKDLQMVATDFPDLSTRSTQIQQSAQPNATMPRLHFQPDGSIADTSPQSVEIREKNGDSIWIAQSRNRLSYEIHTNALRNAFRY